ncbi:MAG TPA: hypothetical protein VHS78_06835 [Candidatus Elarobacter sp.]|jgi:hypothetical protein|nr:hypothetical protein [Candidatus Elarobacter sp.]
MDDGTELVERVLNQDEVAELLRILLLDDDQTAVLRGQLMIEIRLIEVLAIRFPGFERLAPHIEFSKKSLIALREKLIPELLYQALMALARLRNEFSHPPLKLAITEDDERHFLKKTPPWFVPLLDVVLEDHSVAINVLGRKTRMLIALLGSQLIATQQTLRERPDESLIDLPPSPPKEWVREQFRRLDERAERGDLPVLDRLTPPPGS